MICDTIGRKSEWTRQEHCVHVFAKLLSQVWWSKMKRMMITPPIIIPASKENLKLPNEPTDIHLLYQKMDLIMCQLS